MHWIIKKDLTAKPGEKSNVNRFCGPRSLAAAIRAAESPSAKQRLLDDFTDGMNYRFRLYDDDGELYFQGMCKDLHDQDEDSAFGPLNWAMNDSGCTRIDYRKFFTQKLETL